MLLIFLILLSTTQFAFMIGMIFYILNLKGIKLIKIKRKEKISSVEDDASDIDMEELGKKLFIFMTPEELAERDRLAAEEKEKMKNKVEIVETQTKTIFEKMDDLEEEVYSLKANIENFDLAQLAAQGIDIEELTGLKSELIREQIEDIRVNRQLNLDRERRAIDYVGLDQKISHIVTPIVEIYFKERYYENKESYDLNTGIFKLPVINETVKFEDIQKLYTQFMDLVNKDFLINDLNLIYDLSKVDTKRFIINKYIIPVYVEKMEELINMYREGEIQREKDDAEKLEYQRKVAEEDRQKREFEESELFKVMQQIDSEYERLESTKRDRLRGVVNANQGA